MFCFQWHCGRLTLYTTRLWISLAFLQRSSKSRHQELTPHRKLLQQTGLSLETCRPNRSRLNCPQNLESSLQSRSSLTCLPNLSWVTSHPSPSSRTCLLNRNCPTSLPNQGQQSPRQGRLLRSCRGLKLNRLLRRSRSHNLSLRLHLKIHRHPISKQLYFPRPRSLPRTLMGPQLEWLKPRCPFQGKSTRSVQSSFT